MKTNHIYVLLPLVFTSLFLGGCYNRGVLVIPAETHSHTTVITTYAPPPYAPAHGYRHHHHNHELVFDSRFGAYVIINNPGLYFYGDHYIRFYNDSWQITTRLEDTWQPARQNDIPRKLKDTKHHNAERHEERHEERHDHYDAPEHGHRRHYQDHELSFDSNIGAYIILRQPGVFFHNDRYIRQYRGVWQTTNVLNGHWRTAKDEEIPKKLKSTNHTKEEKRSEKSKGRYKDKWQ